MVAYSREKLKMAVAFFRAWTPRWRREAIRYLQNPRNKNHVRNHAEI